MSLDGAGREDGAIEEEGCGGEVTEKLIFKFGFKEVRERLIFKFGFKDK